MKLAGKVALISGSGRGIGRATALKLAAEGAAVVVNDVDLGPANDTVAAIEAVGGRALACIGDVTDADFGERFVAAALDHFGGLDIIINNAGYTSDAVIQKQSDAQFQAMLEVHVMAPFRILRAAVGPIRAMAERETVQGIVIVCKVVNISSISGTNGNPGQVNYSSAKSALVGMTKTLSKEWGRYKVCVNCVAFGLIDTRLTRPADDQDNCAGTAGTGRSPMPVTVLERMRSLVPLGREGTAEEAAGSIYLMCIPESDYISGQVLLVAGGMNL